MCVGLHWKHQRRRNPRYQHARMSRHRQICPNNAYGMVSTHITQVWPDWMQSNNRFVYVINIYQVLK